MCGAKLSGLADCVANVTPKAASTAASSPSPSANVCFKSASTTEGFFSTGSVPIVYEQ